MTGGPIIIADADDQSRRFYADVIKTIGVNNEVIFFNTGGEVLDYLYATKENPFIIISEIDLPVIDGIKMKEIIQGDDFLREKGVPFVFISTNVSAKSIRRANELSVQGYFEKPQYQAYVERLMVKIFDYWEICKHINNT